MPFEFAVLVSLSVSAMSQLPLVSAISLFRLYLPFDIGEFFIPYWVSGYVFGLANKPELDCPSSYFFE
jgi:hypothetical protein